MPRNSAQSIKLGRNDAHGEVAAAIATGMASVTVTVVAQIQGGRRKGLQAATYLVDQGQSHCGKVLRNGLTVTRA